MHKLRAYIIDKYAIKPQKKSHTIINDETITSKMTSIAGWLVFVEIVVVCISVIIVLLLDAARSLALRFENEAKGETRFDLFLVHIIRRLDENDLRRRKMGEWT